MAKVEKPRFQFVGTCSTKDREKQSIVADLEGTLLRSKSPFPYFLLVALEGGSLIRSIIFTLIVPLAWLLYYFVSEAAGIKVMIYFAFAGQKVRKIEQVARAVLPKFYSEDVHPESFEVFLSCGKKYVVTSCPRIMSEHFAKMCLGAEEVIGTEIEVTQTGYATGFVKEFGVLVRSNKQKAVEERFEEEVPDIGLGDEESDHEFMNICKEAYMVPKKKVKAATREMLVKPVIFHDGRLVQRPTPLNAVVTFLWLPISVILSVFRIMVTVPCPMKYAPIVYKLVGIRFKSKGPAPAPKKKGEKGILFVSTHRTLCDPVFVGVGAGRTVMALTYSVSKLSEKMAPLKTMRLTRDREKDAANIKALLDKGIDLVICPEGTTCREPFLLRFSAMFAELTDRIVPVALVQKSSTFHGTTVRGWKGLDPFFLFMNPFPCFEVTYLDQLPPDLSVQGGKSAIDVANYIQRVLGDTLGFECTNFTRKDKYGMLIGSDGSVPDRKKN